MAKPERSNAPEAIALIVEVTKAVARHAGSAGWRNVCSFVLFVRLFSGG
jgi:hypothetical protein